MLIDGCCVCFCWLLPRFAAAALCFALPFAPSLGHSPPPSAPPNPTKCRRPHPRRPQPVRSTYTEAEGRRGATETTRRDETEDSAAPPCSRHEFKFGAQRSFLRQQRSLGDQRDATAAVARLTRAATRRHPALMHASHVCASGGVIGRRRAHTSLPLPPPPPPSASAAAHCRRRWLCVLVHADSTEKAAPKKAAVEKKRKDPNAPKGALTAYIIFRYESTTFAPALGPFQLGLRSAAHCARWGHHSQRDSLHSHKQSIQTCTMQRSAMVGVARHC